MRTIPAMDVLLSGEWAAPWIERMGREAVKRVVNAELSALRERLMSGSGEPVSEESTRELCLAALNRAGKRGLRRVINATGVVVHTNLGRSLIAESAVRAMERTARGYSNLEYDLEEGTRGQRNAHIEDLLCSLTGAEAALAVNNNAGAVLLCLSALSCGAEVIVSRGELVEIGGSFRVPDIMSFSGAKLVETGTTNRTHLADYEHAITENTSMLLKVHPSNFRIEGFTAAPERAELARLAHDRERPLIFMEDAGSGMMVDGQFLGLQGETSVQECLKQGVDVVTFSGDKMLGGPQIGVIAGKSTVVGRLRKHPVLRALRVDKITLAAFEETLRLYVKGALDDIPTLAMLRRSQESMRGQAERLANALRQRVTARVEVIPVEDAVGGGSCPERPLSGWGVSVSEHPAGGAGRIQAMLRCAEPPILCGAGDGALILHVRTLRGAVDGSGHGDEEALVNAIAGLR